jgi:hypothetical protein
MSDDPIDYDDYLKALSQTRQRRIKTLKALSDGADPYFAQTPGISAEWFATLWQRLGIRVGVSQQTPIIMPSGKE